RTTKPPRLVTNPLRATSLRCERTIASIASSTSRCSARAKAETLCADLNGPLPSIPTSIRRSIIGVTAPAIELRSALAHWAVPPAGLSSLPRNSMSVLPLAVGLACQHWIMLLADVAQTSNQLTGTSSRLSKVSLIAGLMRQCAQQVVDGTTPADEVGLVWQRSSGPSGPASSPLRADLFLGLVSRLTAQERVLVLGLLRGGLRQGALEAVVMAAVADAGGVALEDVRRAVAAQGDLPGVAQTLLLDGPAALDLFRLTVGR